MTEKPPYDLFDWTDDQIIYFMEGAGLASIVAENILGRRLEVDDDDFDVWKHPKHYKVRKATAEAYLYGIDLRSKACEKWHQHCIGKEQ